MTTIGIIAEYNPFHNGHEYQIAKAKELTGADNVVVLMSGNYVQRGTPAIYNKYVRAKQALSGGASLVLELPTCYSTASAELFAKASIETFNKLGIVDYLSFGCECDNLEHLQTIATLLANESEEFKLSLKHFLSLGETYPIARKHAVNELMDDVNLASILDTPNNILAIEYLKALIRTNSTIKPVPIKRIDSGYHSTNTDSNFASATAIRECIYKNEYDALKAIVPDYSIQINEIANYIKENDFSDFLAHKLIYYDDFTKYYDISDFLSNRITNLRNSYSDLSSFGKELLTKNETSTHINRALLHILLNIKKEHIENFKDNGLVFYANPLAIDLKHSVILKMIKEKADIPLIERFGDFYKQQCSHTKTMLDINLKADLLYNYVYKNKYGINLPNDFTISNKDKNI